jgi:hypothetical protein
VRRAGATLLGKNKDAPIPSISGKDETCITTGRSVYEGGRGGDTFETLNGQWSPTVGPITQGGHYFFQ